MANTTLTQTATQVQEDLNIAENGIAPEFSTSSTYTLGSIVKYNGAIYRCTAVVNTPGAWTGSTNWTQITLGEFKQDKLIAGTNITLAKGINGVTITASGMTNPMTSAGDIIIGSDSGTPSRLGIGTSGKILKSNGSAPTWGDRDKIATFDITQILSSQQLVALAQFMGGSGGTVCFSLASYLSITDEDYIILDFDNFNTALSTILGTPMSVFSGKFKARNVYYITGNYGNEWHFNAANGGVSSGDTMNIYDCWINYAYIWLRLKKETLS